MPENSNKESPIILNNIAIGHGRLNLVTNYALVVNEETPTYSNQIPSGQRLAGWINVTRGLENCATSLEINKYSLRLEYNNAVYLAAIVGWYIFDSGFKLNLSAKIEEKSMLCNTCIYFMQGQPPVCNALHLPQEVTECDDWHNK